MTAGPQALDPASVSEQWQQSGQRWSQLRRIAFRFAFGYLVLYNLPFPLSIFDAISEQFQKLWDLLVPWVGNHVLGITHPIPVAFNGSGDRTYDYVALFCMLVIATLATVVWTLADRRPHYARL